MDAKRKKGSFDVDTVNGKVVNEVYYFFGKPGGDAGMFDEGGMSTEVKRKKILRKVLHKAVTLMVYS